MLKPLLTLGLLSCTLVASHAVLARGDVTYVSPERVNENVTIVIPPISSPGPTVHVIPNHPVVVQPPRPHHHPRPPMQVCESLQAVDTSLGKQAKNIHAGRQARQLTRRELERLNEKQNYIIREKADMLADGCLSRTEEQRLLNLLQGLERDIHQARTNYDRRGEGRRDDRGDDRRYDRNDSYRTY